MPITASEEDPTAVQLVAGRVSFAVVTSLTSSLTDQGIEVI